MTTTDTTPFSCDLGYGIERFPNIEAITTRMADVRERAGSGAWYRRVGSLDGAIVMLDGQEVGRIAWNGSFWPAQGGIRVSGRGTGTVR